MKSKLIILQMIIYSNIYQNQSTLHHYHNNFRISPYLSMSFIVCLFIYCQFNNIIQLYIQQSFLQEMSEHYSRQAKSAIRMNNYSGSIALQPRNANNLVSNTNYHPDIHKQKQRMACYDDKVNQIVKKYEPVIEKTSLKGNVQNQNFYQHGERKAYQNYEHSKQLQTSLNTQRQRNNTFKPKSQLQSNRQILQAMKTELHSKLNELSKHTVTQSAISYEPRTPKLQENSSKQQLYDVPSYPNHATPSHRKNTQYEQCKPSFRLHDKKEVKDNKSQYITFKDNEMKIENSPNKMMSRADQDSKVERNNKMIEQQITKLDKKIKQIEQNKRKSCTINKKPMTQQIQNSTVNIKICQSIKQNYNKHKKIAQYGEKTSPPLNQNWKEYNNKYKQYISKIKPFQMATNSLVIPHDSRPKQDKQAYQRSSQYKNDEYLKQNGSSITKIKTEQFQPGCQQQYRVYKRKTVQYEYKNGGANNRFGTIQVFDKPL